MCLLWPNDGSFAQVGGEEPRRNRLKKGQPATFYHLRRANTEDPSEVHQRDMTMFSCPLSSNDRMSNSWGVHNSTEGGWTMDCTPIFDDLG